MPQCGKFLTVAPEDISTCEMGRGIISRLLDPLRTGLVGCCKLAGICLGHDQSMAQVITFWVSGNQSQVLGFGC